jgi:hypothetical protein
MPSPWFRMYRSTLQSPKIQRLKPELFRAWVNILCCTEDDGRIPSIGDLAFHLRLSEEKAAEFLTHLTKAGLIDRTENGFFAHDWDEYQYSSDGSSYNAEKQRRYREKRKALPPNEGNDPVTRYDAVTTELPPRTDTDTDTDKRESNARENIRPANRSRTPWPPDAVVPDEWITKAAQQRRLAGLPEIDLHVAARMFANHYAADTQNPRTMTEFQAKWNNWALKEKSANGTRSGAKSQLEQLADIIAADQGVNV